MSGQIKRYAVKSRYLNEDRRIWVYYPEGFHPDQSYPVLYAHDGEDYLNMGRIRTIVNDLCEKGKLQPLVIVGVPVEKRNRQAEYHPDGERHEAYLSFLKEELIPFVEKSNALPINVKERATIGSSLGAVAGCHFAWNNPQMVQTVISQSGAFYTPAMTERMHTVKHPRHIRYYVMVGEDETNVSTSAGKIDFLKANRMWRDQLEERETSYLYEECPGGHTWGLWQKNLPRALTHFWGI